MRWYPSLRSDLKILYPDDTSGTYGPLAADPPSAGVPSSGIASREGCATFLNWPGTVLMSIRRCMCATCSGQRAGFSSKNKSKPNMFGGNINGGVIHLWYVSMHGNLQNTQHLQNIDHWCISQDPLQTHGAETLHSASGWCAHDWYSPCTPACTAPEAQSPDAHLRASAWKSPETMWWHFTTIMLNFHLVLKFQVQKNLKFSPGTFQDQLLLLLIHRRFVLPDLVWERNGWEWHVLQPSMQYITNAGKIYKPSSSWVWPVTQLGQMESDLHHHPRADQSLSPRSSGIAPCRSDHRQLSVLRFQDMSWALQIRMHHIAFSKASLAP